MKITEYLHSISLNDLWIRIMCLTWICFIDNNHLIPINAIAIAIMFLGAKIYLSILQQMHHMLFFFTTYTDFMHLWSSEPIVWLCAKTNKQKVLQDLSLS